MAASRQARNPQEPGDEDDLPSPAEEAPLAEAPIEEAPVGTASTDGVGADESLAGAALGTAVLAEPGQRLLARIVDTLIVGLPVIIVVRELVSGHDVDVVAPPAVAGCLLLYEAVQLAVWGRTLGKRFAGIEVVAADAIAAESPTGEAPTGESSAPERAAEGATRGGLGVLRSVLRAAVYALPIAVRPVPVLGLVAGVLWVVNAGLMYEGARRQTGHDRLAGTLVVKRPPSPAEPSPGASAPL
ncbi:RDD family protein [Actinomadura fibrosa]|uniref:RDD family protein n=1 Tax=Actinomadura fibrosa TaxID=111802 RepID=A0ABW2XHG0_9ACTN|nr:RDD family protein [Actinomadura fibrosa]